MACGHICDFFSDLCYRTLYFRRRRLSFYSFARNITVLYSASIYILTNRKKYKTGYPWHYIWIDTLGFAGTISSLFFIYGEMVALIASIMYPLEFPFLYVFIPISHMDLPVIPFLVRFKKLYYYHPSETTFLILVGIGGFLIGWISLLSNYKSINSNCLAESPPATL